MSDQSQQPKNLECLGCKKNGFPNVMIGFKKVGDDWKRINPDGTDHVDIPSSSNQQQQPQQLPEFIGAYDLLLLEMQHRRKKGDAAMRSLCFGPVDADKLVSDSHFINSCNDRACETCGHDHSFRPSDDGINTSIDVIKELLDRYAANATTTTITTPALATDMKKVKKADTPNV